MGPEIIHAREDPTHSPIQSGSFTNPTTPYRIPRTTTQPLMMTEILNLESKRHVFPFFDLPRELRDMIYGFSLLNVKLERFMDLARRVTAVAPTNLMTISSPFHMELMARVRKSAHLHVAEVCTVGWPYRTTIVPQQAAIRAFTVVSEVNDHEDSLKIQRTWIEQATNHMPNLNQLNICLGIYCGASKYSHAEWCRRIEKADFTSLHHLKSLDIYERGSQPPANRGGKLPWRCLIMQWDPATGKIQDTDQVRRQLLAIVGDFWCDDRFVHFQDLEHLGYDDGHSMDLDMLRYMMRDGFYCCAEDFIAGVLQIGRNVKKFEPLAERYAMEADELESELWSKINQVPEWVHLSPRDFESTAKN